MATINNENILILCIGLNNFDRIYQQCISSHRRYALTHGYEYRLINKPGSASITASVWLKIPLMLKALEKGYDWVFCIDADCEIKIDTPAIETLAIEGKSLYMAKGFSGRINSGVMIMRNDPEAHELFQSIYDHCNTEVPSADWGENGHIIHFASDWQKLYVLDTRWNNNSLPSLPDYIRHYSAGGPMRKLYRASRTEKMIGWMQRIYNRFNCRKYLPREETHRAVSELMNKITAHYNF